MRLGKSLISKNMHPTAASPTIVLASPTIKDVTPVRNDKNPILLRARERVIFDIYARSYVYILSTTYNKVKQNLYFVLHTGF